MGQLQGGAENIDDIANQKSNSLTLFSSYENYCDGNSQSDGHLRSTFELHECISHPKDKISAAARGRIKPPKSARDKNLMVAQPEELIEISLEVNFRTHATHAVAGESIAFAW